MKALAFVFLAVSAAAAPATPYWLKTYSTAPYRETWTGGMSVKKLDAALPKIVAAVEKDGGRLTQPLSAFVGSATEQQLSVIVPLKQSKGLLKSLRRLGALPDPAVRVHAAPVPLDEVRAKRETLAREKQEKWGALAQTPAAAAAVDEIIEHLTAVETIARTIDGEVLLNLTVKEAR